MTEFTKEQLVGWANTLIEETHTDISISRTDAHAESYRAQLALLEIAMAALTSGTEQEPYGYVHKEVYESEGSCGLSRDHEAHRDSRTHTPLYAAPQLPQPAVVGDDKFRADFERWMVEDEKCILGSSDPYPAGIESRNWRAWNACRAAMLQGAEPVSQRDELPYDPQPQPEIDSVTVYPWVVTIMVLDKELHHFVPLSLSIRRYDDGHITKEDLEGPVREWIEGQIGDRLYVITFFGRMAPYSVPQQEERK